jgi:hypothetical protein
LPCVFLTRTADGNIHERRADALAAVIILNPKFRHANAAAPFLDRRFDSGN